MKKSQLLNHTFLSRAAFAVAPLLLLLLVGCSGPKAANEMLTNATEAYNEAEQNTMIVQNAPVALKEAEEALAKSREMWEAKADKSAVDHHAYIARQRVYIAQETAAFNAATKEIENGEVERQQVLLDVRRSEADRSEARAQGALQEARDERAAAEEARERAELLSQRVRELEARPTDRGLVLTLGDVLFETGKSDMRSAGMKTMDDLALFLKEYPDRNIMIEGFTDSVGSEAFNMELSRNRANSVKMEILSRDIAENRIRTVGYGFDYPVASNDTQAGRQQNRRVEIIISDQDGNISERRQ